MVDKIFNLKNVKYGYPGRDLILDNVNFTLYSGDKIGIFAPNGTGKTTLFHIVMGLIKPISGVLEVFGKLRKKESDFLEVRKKIGFLFQNSDDQLFCPTVLDDVAFGPLNLKKSKEEAVNIARNTLKILGIQSLEKCITHKLSPGEKKMVSLAAVLSMNPEVLLLDEPSSGLDIRAKRKIINVLKDLDVSYIIASHELDLLFETTLNLFTIREGNLILDNNLQKYVTEFVRKMHVMLSHRV